MKGVIWCDFKFSLVFGVSQAVRAYKIRKVAKIEVTNPKRYSRLLKMPHLNTPPHIYITVLENLHNTAQMFTQRTKA